MALMADIVVQIDYSLRHGRDDYVKDIALAECQTIMELARDEILALRSKLVAKDVDLQRKDAEIFRLKERLLDRQIEQERMAREVDEIVANYAKLEQLVEQVKQICYREPGHA
jgi:hypothetical protein